MLNMIHKLCYLDLPSLFFKSGGWWRAYNPLFTVLRFYRPYDKFIPHESYWRYYEELMMSVGGRPHWAKVRQHNCQSLYKRNELLHSAIGLKFSYHVFGWTNWNSFPHVFPRFAAAAYLCFEFWLIYLIAYVCSGWPVAAFGATFSPNQKISQLWSKDVSKVFSEHVVIHFSMR